MRLLEKRFAVLCLLTFLLLFSSGNNVTASSLPGGALISPFDSDAFSPVVERFSGIAKIVRIDNQALFILEEGFVREITVLTETGIEIRIDDKIMAVVSEMRPGDYLISPYWKAREIQRIEIAKKFVSIETSVSDTRAGAAGGKGQYVGDDSWPYDIPILDIHDQVLIDAVVDGVQVTITADNLFIEMSGDILFGYNFDLIPPDILYLLMEFDSTLEVTIDYTAMVGGAIDHDFNLLSFSIPVYSVGFATINVDVGLPTHLTTDGPVCLGGGLSFIYGYSVGIEVLDGDVSPIWTTLPENFTELDPSYGAEADANLKTTVDLGVSASVGIPDVLDLAEAAFDIGVYANTIWIVSPCGWSLDSGVTASLAFTEFTGLLCGPGDCDWTLFDASIYSDNVSCDNLTDNCDCNDTVCPNGCCDGNQCLVGNADEACGSAGEACVACGDNRHCVGGECVAACDAVLCPDGCCDGTSCNPGNTDARCGSGGMDCAQCAGNQQCEGQECRQMCDPSLCPVGCCSGKQCQDGDTNEFCGSLGDACITCEAGTHCDAGVCAQDVDDTAGDDTADDDNWHDDDAAVDDTADDDSIDDDTSIAHYGDDDSGSSGGCGC